MRPGGVGAWGLRNTATARAGQRLAPGPCPSPARWSPVTACGWLVPAGNRAAREPVLSPYNSGIYRPVTFVVLRMRTLRRREVKELAKGHTAGGRTGFQNQGDLIASEQRPHPLPHSPPTSKPLYPPAQQLLTECLGAVGGREPVTRVTVGGAVWCWRFRVLLTGRRGSGRHFPPNSGSSRGDGTSHAQHSVATFLFRMFRRP